MAVAEREALIVRPGACRAVPSHAETHGSFTVIQCAHARPARAPWTTAAYSAETCFGASPRFGHPPASSSAWGKVPVVQGDDGGDAATVQLLDEPAVVVEPTGIAGSAAVRLHPRPRDGEPIGAHPELLNERDILAVPVVLVARHVSRIPATHLRRCPAERVPDRGSSPVLVTAPSTWNAEVAAPHTNPSGNRGGVGLRSRPRRCRAPSGGRRNAGGRCRPRARAAGARPRAFPRIESGYERDVPVSTAFSRS